eukprot:CAMPEP_0172316548 /NCGR_PEP_ID=MMETSP1058-20130122/28643_1 /TAXON_ID=83371 /ORGANISM="Detonula confervacea, Strain CCMP 353" /LENGTH=1098 /DNA_ID=CAMNT_0013030883 /DNA_START=107 /DNA_END=3400 /DNA_ORIENTATION=-
MATPRRKTASVADRTQHHGAVIGDQQQQQTRTRRKTNLPKLACLLLPPLLLTIGLSIFTQSFFLSRTSFDHRSSCAIGSAGNLLTSALGLEGDHVDFLRREGFLSDHDTQGEDEKGEKRGSTDSNGCWVPRRVDSMAIIVVDALRFDFARDHLPLSVGSRLFPSNLPSKNHTQDARASHRGTSKLYQFVADPPTVTMQRLKGLTTGGLPTFADISGSFGGASIDEDSWVEQLKNVPWGRRRHDERNQNQNDVKNGKQPQIAFVGDDTWVDLFPTQFDDCHPFPSFNTRDLDTVDNGCLEHLPRLLDGLVGLKPFNHGDNAASSANSSSSATNNSSKFELIVAHFLGVDHVGHTYGPNNPHMESKLHQIDVMLSNTLDIIDDAPNQSCIVALVLGDHGMTEDGNHGGGSSEEVNAGLFVHFSPGCSNEEQNDGVKGDEIGASSAQAFDSIHQIDLVPTISFLMGLPVPYANIGGLVPDLLPMPRTRTHNNDHEQSSAAASTSSSSTPHIATALALNAAQVWNYLHTYSQTSNDLPMDRLRDLKELLDSAALVYRDAISQSQRLYTKEKEEGGEGEKEGEEEQQQHFFDSTAYRQACGLFKLFLAESTDLGKQVWTQFNDRGMMIGIGILGLAWIMAIPLWKRHVRNEFLGAIFPWNRSLDGTVEKKQRNGSIKENVKGNEDGLNSSLQSFRRLELMTAMIFTIFQCGVLTFSNSYIDNEREIVTFFLSILCLLLLRRWYFVSGSQHTATSAGNNSSVYLPLIVALCSRMNDVFVTGHGLDPSIRLHAAHHPMVFVSSLLVLVILRLRWLNPVSTLIGTDGITPIPLSASIDIFAMFCLAVSWWEKRTIDVSRNGFVMARLAMVALFIGLIHSLFSLFRELKLPTQSSYTNGGGSYRANTAQLALFRGMLFLVIVTGPSTASTAVLIVIQCAALRRMMDSNGAREVPAPVMAAIWRLAIRHVFFATNHHCSFNRLHYSAAFVATDTFYFSIAGFSLFMNTFGWEILGSCLVLVYSRTSGCTTSSKTISAGSNNVWDWFRYFQWTEMLTSCISVSVMKRHLMVWAIFAPRFMFAAVFTVVGLFLWVVDVVMTDFIAPFTTA